MLSFTEAASVTCNLFSFTVDARQSIQSVCGITLTVPETIDFTWGITDSSCNVRTASITIILGIRHIAYYIPSVGPSAAGNYICLVTNELVLLLQY